MDSSFLARRLPINVPSGEVLVRHRAKVLKVRGRKVTSDLRVITRDASVQVNVRLTVCQVNVSVRDVSTRNI